MNMFKESLTAYKSEGVKQEPMGNLYSFQSELGATMEPYVEDLSSNTYNSYYNTYNLEQRKIYELKEKEKKEKEKDPEIDNSLLFMGLGVASLGAVVIVVMSLRK